MLSTSIAARLKVRGNSSHNVYQHDDFTYTETTRTVLEGQLAQRVRRRFGAPQSAIAWLKERYWEGGTEYTRECSSEFVVGSGLNKVTFHPDDQARADWQPLRRDSVYARFDHWLNAAHADARCWAEWVAEAERDANESYVKIPLLLEAGLGTAAAAHSRSGKIGSAYLWGARKPDGWHWELHTILERGIPRPEHGDVFHPRAETLRMDSPTRTAAAAAVADRRRILMWATDQVMPGHGRTW